MSKRWDRKLPAYLSGLVGKKILGIRQTKDSTELLMGIEDGYEWVLSIPCTGLLIHSVDRVSQKDERRIRSKK